MKEAAGEANMTVITIVLIGIVLAAGTIIVRSFMSTTRRRSCCNEAGGTLNGTTCTNGNQTTYQSCLAGTGQENGVNIGGGNTN